MTSEKNNSSKGDRVKEPESRFYVKKWTADEREMSEVRKFFKERKSKKLQQNESAKQTEAQKILEKLVR